MAATFIALVAVSAFVLPTIDNADLSVDMDVDYGGDTLTYMVSLMNASANAKYYVVVMEGSTVVYEKEIIDGYQTGIVEGLDGTKEHRVEIRTGLIPLKVVDSATIPGQSEPVIPVETYEFTAAENTIGYDVTVKAGGGAVTLGVYPSEGEAAVFTKVLAEGANTGTVPDLMFNHEYVVKLFGEDKTYIIKAVTTERADSDIVITGIEGLTYLSAEKALVTKTGNDEQTVQYSVNDGAWTTAIPEFTDAGEYTVKYKADVSDKYKALDEGSVVVNVAKVSYDMSGASWDYVSPFTFDNTEKTVSVTGLPTGVTVNEYSNNSKTNAGDYTASVVSFNYDTVNYNEPDAIADCPWTINKATPEVNVTSAGNTYNGFAQNLVTGSTTGGTLQYKLDSGEYGDDIPQAETVGNHTVYYKVIGDDNYNDVAEASIDVSLLKATYDMSGAGWDYTTPFTYDGTEKAVSVTGLPTGVTVNEYSNNSKTNAGDYTASAVSFNYDTVNYYGPEIADCPWTIDKATPVVNVTSAGNTYDGSARDLVTGSTTGGTLQYKLDSGEYGVDIPQAETVGNHTVYYKVIGDNNYNDVAEASIDVSLLKATYDMTGASWDYVSSFTYDGTEKTVSVTGLPAGVTVNEYTDNGKTDAGNYTASVSFNYDSTNYNEPTIDDCPWTIAKAQASVTGLEGKRAVYSGSAVDLVQYTSVNGGTIYYYVSTIEVDSLEDVVWSVNAQATDKNTYYVYYKVDASSENYVSLEPSLDNMVTAEIVDAVTCQITAGNYTISPQVYINADYGGAEVVKFSVYDRDTGTYLLENEDLDQYSDDPRHYHYDPYGTGDDDGYYVSPPLRCRCTITVTVGGAEVASCEEVFNFTE